VLLQAATVKERLKIDKNFIVMTVVKDCNECGQKRGYRAERNASCMGDAVHLKRSSTAQQKRLHCGIKSFAPFTVSVGAALVW